MSKKRGLSADEKKTKMLEIFYEKRDFFQLKELEKIAPKEKGITQQSVKEVVQALVDDHLVESEKIGTSIYFWSFPSKAIHTKKRKLMSLENEAEECAKKLKKTEESLISEKRGREESEERTQLLKELEATAQEERALQAELKKYRDCDPDYIKQLATETDGLPVSASGAGSRPRAGAACTRSLIDNVEGHNKECTISKKEELKDAINRWTENIFILKSFCKNKFNIEYDVLNKSFSIPEELDYTDP